MNMHTIARRTVRPGRALAAILLGLAVVVPAATACTAPIAETEQVEESDQMSGDTDAEETEAEPDTEE